MRTTELTAERLESFGTTHLVMLVLFALGAWLVVRFGRTHRGTPKEAARSRAFAVAIPLFTIPSQLLQFLPSDYDLGTSLPLQLCDLAWVTATYALWTHRRWAVALTYYWGLTLTSQAIITPSLGQDFPHPRFFMYWGMHYLVVWAAIYLTWGLRLRPDWRGYRLTVAATAAWAVAIYAFNLLTDTNYGYLNEKPESASILDLLGPWPIYVFLEIGLIVTFWAAMTVPWTRAVPTRSRPVPESLTRDSDVPNS